MSTSIQPNDDAAQRAFEALEATVPDWPAMGICELGAWCAGFGTTLPVLFSAVDWDAVASYRARTTDYAALEAQGLGEAFATADRVGEDIA